MLIVPFSINRKLFHLSSLGWQMKDQTLMKFSSLQSQQLFETNLQQYLKQKSQKIFIVENLTIEKFTQNTIEITERETPVTIFLPVSYGIFYWSRQENLFSSYRGFNSSLFGVLPTFATLFSTIFYGFKNNYLFSFSVSKDFIINILSYEKATPEKHLQFLDKFLSCRVLIEEKSFL